MGDRTTVTLTVPPHYKEAVERILEEFQESSDDFTIAHDMAMFEFNEVNGGDLDFLSDLELAGIPFDSNWERGSEYQPGCESCRFTEDGEAVVKTVYEDEHSIRIDKLVELLDDPQALKDLIKKQETEIAVLPWDNQIEYSKRYRLKQLIQKAPSH